MSDATEPGESIQPAEYTYRILNPLTVELTREQIEQVADGGLTRVPAPEDSDHDYVEIEVKDE